MDGLTLRAGGWPAIPAVALALLLALVAPARAFDPVHAARFSSTGDEIAGWFWLRDAALSQAAEYVFPEIPDEGDLVLEITALATDRPSGGRGFPARFDLLWGFPGAGGMGGVFQALPVELPNVAKPEDPLGYLAHGTVVLPRAAVERILPPTGTLFIRIVRDRADDPHIALNAQSLVLRAAE